LTQTDLVDEEDHDDRESLLYRTWVQLGGVARAAIHP
jgi:hypothetical protein